MAMQLNWKPFDSFWHKIQFNLWEVRMSHNQGCNVSLCETTIRCIVAISYRTMCDNIPWIKGEYNSRTSSSSGTKVAIKQQQQWRKRKHRQKAVRLSLRASFHVRQHTTNPVDIRRPTFARMWNAVWDPTPRSWIRTLTILAFSLPPIPNICVYMYICTYSIHCLTVEYV